MPNQFEKKSFEGVGEVDISDFSPRSLERMGITFLVREQHGKVEAVLNVGNFEDKAYFVKVGFAVERMREQFNLEGFPKSISSEFAEKVKGLAGEYGSLSDLPVGCQKFFLLETKGAGLAFIKNPDLELCKLVLATYPDAVLMLDDLPPELALFAAKTKQEISGPHASHNLAKYFQKIGLMEDLNFLSKLAGVVAMWNYIMAINGAKAMTYTKAKTIMEVSDSYSHLLKTNNPELYAQLVKEGVLVDKDQDQTTMTGPDDDEPTTMRLPDEDKTTMSMPDDEEDQDDGDVHV